MSKMPTAVEKITLVVYSVWTYYRRELCHLVPALKKKSLQDNIASGKAQRMFDAFPHLSRAEAGFLGLVMDIISGDEPLEYAERVPGADKWLVELIRGLHIDTTPRPGFREELWQRMLAMMDEMDSRISGEDDGDG